MMTMRIEQVFILTIFRALQPFFYQKQQLQYKFFFCAETICRELLLCSNAMRSSGCLSDYYVFCLRHFEGA